MIFPEFYNYYYRNKEYDNIMAILKPLVRRRDINLCDYYSLMSSCLSNLEIAFSKFEEDLCDDMDIDLYKKELRDISYFIFPYNKDQIYCEKLYKYKISPYLIKLQAFPSKKVAYAGVKVKTWELGYVPPWWDNFEISYSIDKPIESYPAYKFTSISNQFEVACYLGIHPKDLVDFILRYGGFSKELFDPIENSGGTRSFALLKNPEGD